MKVKQHIENHDELNHFDLRSDIENNNITGGNLLFLGKQNDVWVIAIDNTDIRYEYTSEYEYNQDIKILIK
jgi:hypothetical protein